MPVRNGEHFLRESLENLLLITQFKDQILIVDDGSSDATGGILQEYREKDMRISVITLPPSGLVIALNEGLKHASHDFIARADVDDIYEISRLDKQVNLLELEPNVAAVFTDYVFWNPEKDEIGLMPSGAIPSATKLSLVDAFRTPHPSVMFRKGAVTEVGGYLESEFPAEDLGLWIRLSHKFEIASIPEPLLRYRVNPSGISASRREEMLLKKNELLGTLDYKNLLQVNLNTYSQIKTEYKSLGNGFERLALHNFDLLICVNRANLGLSKKLVIATRVACRFINPRVLYAFLSLVVDRRARKS
jgi:glycosyltransferase involved in cell wall biosynthesis